MPELRPTGLLVLGSSHRSLLIALVVSLELAGAVLVPVPSLEPVFPSSVYSSYCFFVKFSSVFIY